MANPARPDPVTVAGDDPALGVIETEVALLVRRAQLTAPARGDEPHRLLDRAAYLLLRILDTAGPASINQLAATLGLDGSTVTRQIIAMEQAGLVTRGRDRRDARVTVVTTTAAGLARMRRMRAARRAEYATALAGWTAADRETLGTLLGRLNDALDAHRRKQTARA